MSENEKKQLVDQLGAAGIDAVFVISESFLGYKYRKHNHQLYSSDASIPTKLIKMYYALNVGEIAFDNMKKSFVSRYVLNESKLEDINDEDIHGKEEMAGFKKMYEYIHSDDVEYMFDVYTLKDLHKKLFSCTPYPEFGGNFRNSIAYLHGTRIELCDWSMIRPRLDEEDKKVQILRKCAPEIKASGNVELMLDYLDKCVELKCQLIKIHPFSDGNGRTIRGFINKLLEDVGLPPIYIESKERMEYQNAMNLAVSEGNYEDIKNFYRYKICDSIIELDINNRVREFNKNLEISEFNKQKVKEK